jgi:hypothetical protein
MVLHGDAVMAEKSDSTVAAGAETENYAMERREAAMFGLRRAK